MIIENFYVFFAHPSTNLDNIMNKSFCKPTQTHINL